MLVTVYLAMLCKFIKEYSKQALKLLYRFMSICYFFENGQFSQSSRIYLTVTSKTKLHISYQLILKV